MMQPDLAALIKAYRARIGLTQEQLAARWQMSVNTVRGIEAGKATTHHVALMDLLSQLI